MTSFLLVRVWWVNEYEYCCGKLEPEYYTSRVFLRFVMLLHTFWKSLYDQFVSFLPAPSDHWGWQILSQNMGRPLAMWPINSINKTFPCKWLKPNWTHHLSRNISISIKTKVRNSLIFMPWCCNGLTRDRFCSGLKDMLNCKKLMELMELISTSLHHTPCQ